ncbi:hypothetical protein [Brevundimonas sp.]|uniref:hypothetical protein n=1 Tax=Brevundimonas sp. TaxID=1871086 RepID=UPI002FC6AC6F
MSCNLAVAAALFFASDPVASALPESPAVQAPAEASAATGASALASEPAFAALVQEAQRLKAVTDGWIVPDILGDAHFVHMPAFQTFKTQIAALAAADMNGHLELKQRGTDSDLTCIMRGIAEDMPQKLAQLEEAAPGASRKMALEELSYLLNDNAEVILAPALAH